MSQKKTQLDQLSLQPFKREDQEAVQDLILAGLGEHWGHIDRSINPDLNDISASYAGATFLVAWLGNTVVGTGALVAKSDQEAEIVRMSVAKESRRQGIGKRILQRLCQEAQNSGFQRIVLETTSTWHEVIEFYKRFGFRVTHQQEGPFGGEVYFALDIGANQ